MSRNVREVVEVEVDGRPLHLTNVRKVLWPGLGLTKGWMLDYYARIAPVLLPHLAGRPLTLHRFPDGIEGPRWFQTRAPAPPSWVRTVTMRPARSGKVFDVCVIDDLASLLWAVNLGSIELHPFLACADDLASPTMVVFDLDPGPPAGMIECCTLAVRLREVLEHLGLEPWAKVTGGLGLHVHVPVARGAHTYDDTKSFARAVAAILAREHPDLVVDRMTKRLRTGRVFVDWSQNDPGKSTISAYSLRGLDYPTVALPVSWDELEWAARERTDDRLVFSSGETLDRVARGREDDLVVSTAQRLPR